VSDHDERDSHSIVSFAEQLERVLRSLQETSDAVDAQRAQNAARLAEADDQRAESARAGDLGPEWRTIQRRIDTGLTSVKDVFSGEDTSREAEALRTMSRRNLALLRASWESDAEDEDDAEQGEELAPHLQAQGLARQAREHYERLAAQITETLRDAQQGGQR